MSDGTNFRETEFAVVGGGLVGAAVAYGLARAGRDVTVLDEGDIARRASRANFALVWVQTKGIGLSRYASWSETSARLWPGFAGGLKEITGLDVAYRNSGGFMLCLSERELELRRGQMKRLQSQPGAPQYPYEVFDHQQTHTYLPEIGPDVVGSVYCPLDGDVNSLRLFLALHRALEALGARYRPEAKVEQIRRVDSGWRVSSAGGEVFAETLVIAAGLDTGRLAAQIGLNVPVRPSKGQVLVTEKVAPFLHYPVSVVRQTDEGGVMVGDSQEDMGFDDVVTQPVISIMARRAVQMFPMLRDLTVVRTWSASRVMSPDGFPAYAETTSGPKAYALICHSGVTLAAAHAVELAQDILDGALSASMAPFSTERFDVPTLV